MYWVLGSINSTVTSPKLILDSDQISFHEWMCNRGWKFFDHALDPLSTDYSVTHVEGRDKLLCWDKDVAEWEHSINIPNHLLKMYEKRGVYSSVGALPLCETCENNELCWNGIEGRKPTSVQNLHWSHVSLPWIGHKYNIFRMVVLGINPYEAGGIDFYPNLIPLAKEEMSQGKIKVNFGHEGYKGTVLWHRIGIYASQIILKFVNDDDVYRFPELSHIDAYDWISFTNHIKCSPVGDRSEPSQAMWENCHSILKDELYMLTPKILLVLGSGDNIYYLLKNVLEETPILIEGTKYARIYQGIINGKQIVIINVPHPAAPGLGASKQISKDLDEILYKCAGKIQSQLNLPRITL
jgi:hypothetical protein